MCDAPDIDIPIIGDIIDVIVDIVEDVDYNVNVRNGEH